MHINTEKNSTRINHWEPELLTWIQYGRHYGLSDVFYKVIRSQLVSLKYFIKSKWYFLVLVYYSYGNDVKFMDISYIDVNKIEKKIAFLKIK